MMRMVLMMSGALALGGCATTVGVATGVAVGAAGAAVSAAGTVASTAADVVFYAPAP